MTPDSREPLRGELRRLTAPAHRSLDHHPILAPLVRAPIALDDYVRALKSLHAPQRYLEAELRQEAAAAGCAPRLNDLDDDLRRLGATPYPLAVAPPVLASEVARFGALYVIEGANLGGQVIARQLEQSLPGDAPRAFFAGAEGHARWERFWRTAGALLTADSLPVLADAAIRTFAFFRDHLDQVMDSSHNLGGRHGQ